MDQTKIAYIAGIFDQSSTLVVLSRMELRVKIYGYNPILIELLNHILPPRQYKDPIVLYSRQAALLLETLLPYLVVKKDKADLAIEFQKALSARKLSKEEGDTYREYINSL